MWLVTAALLAAPVLPCGAGTVPAGATTPLGDEVWCEDERGRRDGPFTRAGPDGELLARGQYTAAEKEGLWQEWYEDGTPKLEQRYRRGVPHGPVTHWWENGNKKTAGAHGDAGLRDGPWAAWHENGQPYEQGRYAAGHRTGKWTRWNDDGLIQETGDYQEDKKEGVWLSYDKKGQEALEERFTAGERTAIVPRTVHAWLPVQGDVTFTALFGARSALQASFYLGYAGGLTRFERDATTEGPFWGAGGRFGLGSADVTACGEATRCASRWTVGPAVRAGWAWGTYRENRQIWPDTYVFAQLTALYGAETVPSAPLSPAQYGRVFGARLDLGVNSVGWTRWSGKGWLEAGSNMTGSDGAAALWLACLAFVLTNHLELSLEVTQSTDGPGVRGGFAIGAGF